MPTSFGEFTFDPERRELVRGGEPLHLSPKAFRLLEVLLAHRPRAVPKETLYDELWSDVHVEEANLKNLIAEIRAVLDDDPRAPRFIRTHHRFGYSFAAPTAPEAPVVPFFLCVGTRSYPLAEGETLLGRDPSCGVTIDHPSVSRVHARITVSGNVATIADLESKNGTFVGGERVTDPAPIRPGDEIRLGRTSATLRERPAVPSTVTAQR